jgi:hypothetical protein
LFVGNTVYVSGADFLFDTNQASDSTNGIENTDATTGGLGCWFYFFNAFNIKIRNHSILTGGTAPPRAIIEFSNARNISLEDIGSQSLPINLNNRTPRIVQMFSSNLATNLSFKRCYFTPYSQSFSNAIAQYIVGCFLQNVWYNGYTKALPVFANNQVIKGSQGNITLGTSGIPTTFSLSGTHFYDQFGSNTSGAIGILFSEKTTDAISANAYVLASANSSKPIVFNGTGRLIMQTSGDTITYTRPYFVLGYSGFTGHTISASGTYSIEYDIDKGDGFSGTWKAIANITTEVVNPAVGFKEKIRFTANNTATTNQVQGFYLNGITTLAQQQAAIYVDTSQAKLELTGLIAGSEVRVYRTSDEAELAGIEASETTFSYTYEWSSNFDVDIVVFRIDYIPVRLTLALTSTGLSAPIQQRFDRVYLNP